jgi:IS605 OrfB family transposase
LEKSAITDCYIAQEDCQQEGCGVAWLGLQVSLTALVRAYDSPTNAIVLKNGACDEGGCWGYLFPHTPHPIPYTPPQRGLVNIRKDTLHKLTTLLAKNHGTVVIEDLNISGMLANHKLAKAIADMSFFEFRRQLTYKCQLYGSKLVVVDRWFPSSKTCSNCGTKKETLTLNERVFECGHCGFSLDRDLNAAINLSLYVSGS